MFNESFHDGEPIEYSAVEVPGRTDERRWCVLAVSESYTQVFEAEATKLGAETLACKLNRCEAAK